MQNAITTLALLFWPIVAACLFAFQPLMRAILCTVLGAQLLLPVGAGIKIPIVPQLDKITIANLCILFGCIFFSRKPSSFGKFGLVEILMLMFVLGPFITSGLNSDPIVLPGVTLPGVGLYDAGSASLLAFVLLIPFFVGRRFLSGSQDIVQILRAITIAMTAYSIPLLFEVRFSPQLHNWVYGYFPSDFIQQVRDGGYRPMVFMGHGLVAAQFVLLGFLAATALWRTRSAVLGISSQALSGYLAAILFFCKTLGVTVYAAAVAPFIIFLSPKAQLRLAIILVMLALLYPTIRSFDLFPTRTLVGMARSVSDERARSLQYRFDNEDILLAHASERPFFGWGRYGRNRVYDPQSGRDITVTDGEWIISMGQFGLAGFISQFGLLSLGIFRAASAFRHAPSTDDQVRLAVLCLLIAISVLNLLPNSGLVPFTWLLAGALLGRSEKLLAQAKLQSGWRTSAVLVPQKPSVNASGTSNFV
jgi:hypothetical protein